MYNIGINFSIKIPIMKVFYLILITRLPLKSKRNIVKNNVKTETLFFH